MWFMLVFAIKKKNLKLLFKSFFALQIFISNLVGKTLAQKLVLNIKYVSANCFEKWITFGTSRTLVIICVFSALETEKYSDFTPAVVWRDPDVFFQGLELRWKNCDCTNIYTHNFHNHIHHYRCSADVEKERTLNPGVSPPNFKKKTSEVSNVSLFCSLLEWLHPVCGFLLFFSPGASTKTDSTWWDKMLL